MDKKLRFITFIIVIMFIKFIKEKLAKVTGLKPEEIHLETPEREEFGDYSTNIAMTISSRIQIPSSKLQTNFKLQITEEMKTPKKIAEKIVEGLEEDKELSKLVEKIEIAGAGFINFWLKNDVLVDNLIHIVNDKDGFGKTNDLKGKKFLIEHTSPNTIKTLHVGHVRNNVFGMAVHNILEFAGADVKLDAINNDRGIHVMKAVWAYMKYAKGKEPKADKPDHFVDKFYVLGVKAYEDSARAKEEIKDLLRKWEAGDEKVRKVWKKLRDWTFEGFKETYKRLGSHHDHQWFESDFYQRGKEMVEEGLKKGIFRRLEDGAVLSNLKKYGLTDAVVLRADGTSMYHTQDLYLTRLKRDKFPSDLYIWVIGPEQELYLKQLFAMCEQLGIGKVSDYMHLSYGFVYLKDIGKMSSREGNVISADWLIDAVVKRAKEIIEKSQTPLHSSGFEGQVDRGLSEKEKNEVSEMIGLAAIKYGFLKLARTTDLQFDIDESLSLEGNSGPYLQYTYARTRSVLRKFEAQNSKRETNSTVRNSSGSNVSNLGNLDLGNYLEIRNSKLEINLEELSLLRHFVHFPEIISMSAKNYSPNLLCNYLYDLASKFNLFYNRHRILADKSERVKEQEGVSSFRLVLTQATGQILKNGLNLLGIQSPEKM